MTFRSSNLIKYLSKGDDTFKRTLQIFFSKDHQTFTFKLISKKIGSLRSLNVYIKKLCKDLKTYFLNIFSEDHQTFTCEIISKYIRVPKSEFLKIFTMKSLFFTDYFPKTLWTFKDLTSEWVFKGLYPKTLRPPNLDFFQRPLNMEFLKIFFKHLEISKRKLSKNM